MSLLFKIMKKVIALIIEDKETETTVAKMYTYREAAVNRALILKTAYPKRLKVDLFINGEWIRIKKNPQYLEKILGNKPEEIPFITQDFHSL